jgi:homogentisate 1,2-dioxygenase
MLPERMPVYNLEVEGCHEYVANGIVVHNCMFPLGPHKDCVDASSGAFNKLALTPQVGYAVATEEAVRFAPIPASMGLAGMRMF